MEGRTSYILGALEPHVTSGYHIGQCRARKPINFPYLYRKDDKVE